MAGKPRGLCHYCETPLDGRSPIDGGNSTWDHIVAKSYLPKVGISMIIHQRNKVPCCVDCNDYKKNNRSDCNCETCMYAWEVMAEYILPRRKKDIPVIIMAERFRLMEDEEEETECAGG